MLIYPTMFIYANNLYKDTIKTKKRMSLTYAFCKISVPIKTIRP